MIAWTKQHVAALAHALRQLVRSPGSSALNVLVIAIALALPFAGLTILENVRPLSEQLAVEPEISIFLSMEIPRERATALAPQIRRLVQDLRSPARLEFVPREKALTMLQDKSGMADTVTALGENPLPDGYVLRLASFRDGTEAGRIDSLAAQLKALPGVDYVQVDSAWVKRLAALLHILRLALLFLGATLGVVVVAVAFNTIRLQLMTHREEIGISRLFGATDAYIRRPFYYTGAMLGLLAGAVALGVVAIALHPLNEAIAEFARLYASEFRLGPLGLWPTLGLLALSGTMGLVGAGLSVRRHLARLD
jgi:cell division transport system permease protein